MRRRSGKALLVALVAFLILGAGAGVWLLLRSASPQPSMEEGRTVADSFLASIRDGRPDDAWQSTSAEFKSAEGREVFVKRVRRTPVFKEPLDFVSMQTVQVGTEPRGEFLYRTSSGDASGKTVRLLVNKEYGEWKIDRVTTD